MATLPLNTRAYVRSHGREPRGRGKWLFRVRCGLCGQGHCLDLTLESGYNQTLTEAALNVRRQLKDKYPEIKVSLVELEVLP